MEYAHPSPIFCWYLQYRNLLVLQFLVVFAIVHSTDSVDLICVVSTMNNKFFLSSIYLIASILNFAIEVFFYLLYQLQSCIKIEWPEFILLINFIIAPINFQTHVGKIFGQDMRII